MTYSEIISRVPLAKREVADAYLKGLAEGVRISFNPSPEKNADAQTRDVWNDPKYYPQEEAKKDD